MKITYGDLTDSSMLVANQLQALIKEAEKLEAQVKRIRSLNHVLIYLIQCKKITDTEDIDCAVAWLKHSDLSVKEIMDNIID